MLPPVKVLRAASAVLPMTPGSESGAGAGGLNEADVITPRNPTGRRCGTVSVSGCGSPSSIESAARADRFAHDPVGFFGVIFLVLPGRGRIPVLLLLVVLLEFDQVFWIGLKIPSKWIHPHVFIEPGAHVPS